MTVGDTWYRYYDRSTYENPEPTLRECRVVRETNKTVFFDDFGFEKRVLKYGRIRWAYPTKEEALESYIQRKWHQLGHAERMAEHAKEMHEMANAIKRGERQARGEFVRLV